MLDTPNSEVAGATGAPVVPMPAWKAREPALPPLDPSGMGSVLGALEAPAIVRNRLKGIAILGSNPANVMQAPFDDEGWLIYACSPDNTPFGHPKNCRTLPRHDQWFELHAPIEDPTRPFGYLHYVASLPLVWMRDARAGSTGIFKGARPYPERALFGTSVIEKRRVQVAHGVWQEQEVAIPRGDGRFCPYAFSSSISYIMAKAIVDIEGLVGEGRMGGADGPPMIGLWGIMQSAEAEYAYQRGGTQYFLHEAMRAGIKMLVDPESRLFDMPNHKW